MVRPLPGIRFETVAPPLADALPRMDVAVFVGLAASGPADVPVAVEDPVEYAAIFGDLAVANLGSAVRAFFRNGGRRCWIIRVSPRATRCRIPLPGLVRVRRDGSGAPAFAVARSQGAWSNTLTVRTALEVESLDVVGGAPPEITIAVTSRNQVRRGDLLRLGGAALVFAESVEVSGRLATVRTGPERLIASPPGDWMSAERLSFQIRAGDRHLDDLAFSPLHPRYWASLPSDAELFGEDAALGALVEEAARPRFPIAGPHLTRSSEFLPLGMPFLPSEPATPSWPGSDGKTTFNERLFLDRALADVGTLDLLNEADFIRYQSPTPRKLCGVHAALGIEEATIIAVPDAALAGWSVMETPRTLTFEPPKPPPPPASRPLFDDCDREEAPAPPPASNGSASVTLTSGVFDDSALGRIHGSLLRLAAARGDLFAILTVPQHYREAELIAHAAGIAAADAAALSYGALYHPWLTGREENALGQLRTSPPDGAIAGTMAKRSLLRGAWIAPAGEPLSGVVALAPPMRRAYWQDIQDAQINIVRQEPAGFVCLNADTLSADEDLRPINVRRLLQLLRRAALKLGANYVFEPNDAAFRRSVQRGFEGMLDGMFLRGAFAGRVAGEGFQVIADESVNTPASVDPGRFIVDIKVAPSLPLTFLTVRLVQAADRTFVTEGR